MNVLKIGLVQYSPEWENPELSIRKLESMINSTDLEDTDLLIFPEMSLTGFTMRSKEFAEELDSISFRYFMELSKKLKVDIFAGLIEYYDEKIFNSLIHFDSKGLIRVRYHKIHPFTNTGEHESFTSGNSIITTKIGKVIFGLSICYDLRFPELFREYAKTEVDILCNVANWPVDRINHWDKLLQARAIENLSYFIGVNRVGSDPKFSYNGHSAVVDPMGNIIITSEEEKIIFTTIDIDNVKKTRESLPFLKDIKLI